jgi:hypothetical protein
MIELATLALAITALVIYKINPAAALFQDGSCLQK